jgi:hypothetical protein
VMAGLVEGREQVIDADLSAPRPERTLIRQTLTTMRCSHVPKAAFPGKPSKKPNAERKASGVRLLRRAGRQLRPPILGTSRRIRRYCRQPTRQVVVCALTVCPR